MYDNKILSLERKITMEELKFNQSIKINKINTDTKILHKKNVLKKKQFENENSLHTQLRDSKLEKNNILNKIKDIEDNTNLKLKHLQDLQNEYDENIIKKNNLEEQLLHLGIQI